MVVRDLVVRDLVEVDLVAEGLEEEDHVEAGEVGLRQRLSRRRRRIQGFEVDHCPRVCSRVLIT